MDQKQLLDLAFEAMANAYAPYSNYHVGACVLCKDGATFKGCNIENASYGATNCGERTAIFATYAAGYKKEDIVAIAIVTDGGKVGAPCGICRQVLSELMPIDAPIYLSNGKEVVVKTMEELLPMRFGQEDLI